MKMEIAVAIDMNLEAWCSSEAAKAYCWALRNGESVKIARLVGEKARIEASLADLRLGLPALASGVFEDANPEEWGVFKSVIEDVPSEMCVYISGSGTKYLLFQKKIAARLRSEETRTKWYDETMTVLETVSKFLKEVK